MAGNQTYDVIVVGGGTIGLSIGWRLAQAGLDVTVLERDSPGRAGSWAASGMLCPMSEGHGPNKELLALRLASMRLYPDFVRDLEAAAAVPVEYDECGALVVAVDMVEARDLKRLLVYQESLNLPARWWSRDRCLEAEPMVSPRTVGAIAADQDHRINNRALVSALTIALKRSGGALRERTSVQRVVVDGGRVAGVMVGDERLTAGTVVVAAGAESNTLAGLPDRVIPPVRPVRSQQVELQMDPDAPLIRRTIRGRRSYLVPQVDGKLMVGASSEPESVDPHPTAGGILDVLRGAYELVPGSYELPLVNWWSGFRAASLDNLPVLGATEIQGLVMATGLSGDAILLTPVTAWAIAALVTGGTTPMAIQDFAIGRFALNAPKGPR